MSESLWPHGRQHSRPPCPSPTPRACSNSCPSNQWCHSTISSSVIPLSSCLQSFPVSRSFPMSQFFVSGGQSTGVSASASVLPMNIQDWFNQNSEDKSQQYGKWDFHFGSVFLDNDTGVLPLLAVWEQRNNSIQEYPSFTWFPVYCLTIICCNRHSKHLVCLLEFCLSSASKRNIEG